LLENGPCVLKRITSLKARVLGLKAICESKGGDPVWGGGGVGTGKRKSLASLSEGGEFPFPSRKKKKKKGASPQTSRKETPA